MKTFFLRQMPLLMGEMVPLPVLCIGAAAFCCFFFLTASFSKAMDLSAELHAGYDSNPALSDPSDGSGFSGYGLGAGQSFLLFEDLSLHLSAEGRYQDYWSVGDNYRLQAGTALSYVLAGGKFLPSLIGEAAVYRDRLIEADERNEGMAGITADWILTKRITLGFEQTFRWLGYLNWAKPFSGKGQGRNVHSGGGQGGGGGKNASATTGSHRVWAAQPSDPGRGNGNSELNRLYSPRDNRLTATGVDLDIFLLPTLNGRVYGAYGDLNSSLDMESFREIQVGAALSWKPAEHWLVGVEATWYRTQYYSVPDTITTVRRMNYSWWTGLQVSRFWGKLEFFGQAGWKSGEAPLDYETYSQTVIQCGLSYSY